MTGAQARGSTDATIAGTTVRRTEDAIAFEPEAGGAGLVPALVLGRAVVEQFLVPSGGGRLQAYPFGYDPIEREWFDLDPGDSSPTAWAHWTQPGATANTQCLACHVTGYEKGYDAGRDRYDSRWVELGVGCEACHGPGREHVRVRLSGLSGHDPYGTALDPVRVTEPCMPCHSLSVPLADGYRPGAALADFFDVELLDTDALHPDGQLRGEAYEWAAFRMSRMAAAGVTCLDCHEPHGGRPRAEGDALCLGCHEPALASTPHTHHPPGPGSECVGCHMPDQVFMGRDRRRDHAFVRPDPERSRVIGAPDACTMCHRDREQTWAAERVAAWYGDGGDARRAARALAVLLEAGRRGSASVSGALARLLGSDLDPIRRASAARFLAPDVDGPGAVEALLRAATDSEPLVRASAVRTLGAVAARPEVQPVLVGAARDPRRLVRLEAAFALAAMDLGVVEQGARASVERAFEEWVTTQGVLAELPETHFNQGLFWTARGDAGRAEAAYRRAIALWPHDLTPRQNLALLLLDAGEARRAEDELRAALARQPDWPPALFGLALVHRREGRWAAAIESLEACVRRAPSYPRAAYHLGEARLALGDESGAAAAFEQATADATSRREALREVVRLAYRRGDRETVARWLPQALLADPATAGEPAVREALGLSPPPPAAPPRQ